ncbi:hypothetical protein ES288_D04G012400v1 [Gossypium darwinii]|uniref:Uncharacterized protein n=1 Tax=Gossypium darwinii TaxID=34276 RepID=A0A5D2CVT6_GOSDA|nr:hypothetical protein ES288_D04G012400v1 [Gossypium darwinii]
MVIGLKLSPAGQPNIFFLLQAPSPRTKPFLNSTHSADSKQPSTKSQLTNLPSGSQLLISQSESQIFSRENPPFLLSISLPAH